MDNFVFVSEFKKRSHPSSNPISFSNGNEYIVYVEGYDDEKFYTVFLKEKFLDYDFHIKIAGSNGRHDVIEKAQQDILKKQIYVIDADYEYEANKDLKKNYNIIITSGYSMENFFFYNLKEKNNLKIFFETIQKKYKLQPCECDYDEFNKILELFFKNTLPVHAYRMAEQKICGRWKKTINEEIGEDLSFSYDYEDEINKIISEYNDSKKKEFLKYKAKFSVKIRKNGYMLIRGHDLYNLLIGFLKKKIINAGYSTILNDNEKFYEYCYGFFIPDEFMEQIMKKLRKWFKKVFVF